MAFDTSQALSIQAARTIDVGRGNGSGGGGITLPVANLYRNTFESKLPDPGEVNTINFAFSGLYNGLVTDLDGGTTGGLVNNGSGIIDPPTAISGKDWRAYDGQISMRVSCAATTAGTQNAEQNATFDSIPARDTWVRYWMRIPDNYAPTTDHLTSQHKLFVIFQDGYSSTGIGSTVWMNIYYNSDLQMMQSGLIIREGTSGGGGGVGDLTPLFHITDDRGKWMQFVFLLRMESSPGASDGEVKFWSRFKDDSSFVLKNQKSNLSLVRSTVSGQEGFRHCRFLSAREGNAAERQDFLFDVIEVADTPLVPTGTEGL